MGPIGYPDEVNAYLRDVWGSLGEVSETAIGNVIAHIGGSGPKVPATQEHFPVFLPFSPPLFEPIDWL